MSKSVILKSKVGEHQISTSAGGKPVTFKWNAKNNFTCEVPVDITYVSRHNGDERMSFKNYAQFLLNSYPNDFELVEVKEEEVVSQPKVKKLKGEVK